MPQPLVWVQVKQSGQIPAPRSGHTFVTVGKTHILFGGLDSEKKPDAEKKNTKIAPNNQVYSLRVAPNVCEWKLVQCSGDPPLPRTNHAACAITPEKMLIFGGFYTSNLRFNDTFILRTTNFQWSQPPNQKVTGEPKNAESKIGAPEPRGNHSATFHKNKVYVFGGHGGVGYATKSFNDLYVLDCESFEWSQLEPSGTPPDPRGGHNSQIMGQNDLLMIFGGWNQISQFQNVIIYDINNNSWVDPEISHEIPKWNMAGIMVPSIPSWKYFIFGGQVGNFEEGGNRTASRLVDDTFVLDVDAKKWSPVQLEEEKPVKPKTRESTTLIYDPSDSRIMMFGGWSNAWMNDIYALNVSSIVGPPYAIYSIKPCLGPLTGKTKVSITGDGFKDSQNIIVRFFSGKASEDVQAVYVSPTELTCETPSYEKHGARKSEVKVSIDRLDFTIMSQFYSYFLNSKAEKSLMFGPGVLRENAIKTDTMFYIQTRNLNNQNRESGADEFQIEITRPDVLSELEEERQREAIRLQQLEQMDPEERERIEQESHKKRTVKRKKVKQQQEGEEGENQESEYEEVEEEVPQEKSRLQLLEEKANIKYSIHDNDDGSYIVKYQIEEPCEVIVNVKLKNERGEFNEIRGAPKKAQFLDGVGIKNNQYTGQQLVNYVTNKNEEINKLIDTSRDNINIKDKNIQEDVNSLLEVMENLKKISDEKENILLLLDENEQILRTLEKHDMKKETEIKKVNKMQEEWKNLLKISQTVEKDISGPVKQEADKTKEKIKKFEEQLKEYLQGLKKETFYQYKTGIKDSQERFTEVQAQIDKFTKTLQNYEYYSKMFNFPDEVVGCQKNLDAIKQEVAAVQLLWEHIKKCEQKFSDYKRYKWATIDPNDMEDEVKKLRKFLIDMKGIDKRSNVFTGINEDLRKWGTFIPLLTELKDPAMNTTDSRHWKEVKVVVNQDFAIGDDMELDVIWNLKLFDFREKIEDISEQAKQELKMEKGIIKVDTFWKDVQFELLKHKDTDIRTLKMLDEHFETLEEHQLQVNNMLLSKYVKFFEKDVEKWKQDLGAIYDVIQLLSEVQKTWSFLENLFIQSEEVKKELPKESEQFVGIDKNMKEIMESGCQIKIILKFCTQPNMLKSLEKIQADLKVCEKALNEFLDSKRRAFPRFYFVSVNDLLDILSNGNSPAKINRHMSKIFQAIDKLELQENDNERPFAKKMITCVGQEEVSLVKPLQLLNKVETYLQAMIDSMIDTLRELAKKSFGCYDSKTCQLQMDRKTWIDQDPAQIALLVNNIMWSVQVEEAFGKIANGDMNALKDYYKRSVEALTELIRFVRGDLTKSLRQKLMCLITMDAHSRDTIGKLIDEHVRKPDEFQWQSQLKFYWVNNDALIRIADASFNYSYEYLGNGPRLVITPLTDRIYVTATQALHLKMGCAPAGPAGTGKTETTKDLANALAKACYVFNCSSEMNYESMGNIYKGLASSGCWGCFDEFNRLLPEVLSVCSVQFKAVTDAIKQQKKTFLFPGGGEISLDPTCGVFITMNPGYLGRAELPEGLKALFRPITVVVPDLELICENMLMAEGFEEAKTLAHKFVTLYMLCRDLLSKQLHYDWGLRAIKSVLVVAGGFKRAEANIAEQALLMRALRDFNIPKIAFQDLDVFSGLLSDLFPNINIPRKRDMAFEGIIEQVTAENRLDPDPDYILKIVQASELLEIRHCIFVMGPPGAGKSTTWKMLAKAQDKAGKKTTVVDLDPKVVSTRDLYGYNLPTKEWKDGLVSKVLRSLSEIQDVNPKWILLDGDLDANWIESMNSVMDDNKILTLANNERIPLKPHMRMLFEIRDLRFATPATVSRAGILYISDDKGYQWRAYVKSWVKNNFNDDKFKQDLQKLFDRYIEGTLLFLKKHCKTLIPVNPISMIISLCKALLPLLQGEVKNMEYHFVYCCVWAIGGVLSEKDSIDYRKDFSNWWKGEWKTSVKFPSKGTVFDYFVEQNSENVKFDEWAKRLSNIDFDPQSMVMGNITVPTKETLATSELVKQFIYVQQPVLMIGQSGCGKTQLAKGILRDIVKAQPDNFTYQLINFNYYTDSTYLQAQLEQQLEKKAGRQFGPQGKGKLIYFIDDLNMPQLDPYDTQTAIALLRQHADYGHWYDLSKLSLKDIINTQTIAAMNPSAGSFFVNPRYQRHFWTVSIPIPDNESLFLIYNTFLSGHLKRFKPAVSENGPAIIKAALQLHTSVIQNFRKTAINFHYEFNLRHISNVIQGLLLADPAKFIDSDKLIRLWVHESERTYGDRLVSMDNLNTYKALMFDLLKKQFTKFNFSRFFAKDNPENLIFCNFLAGIGGDRFYDQMPNDKLEPVITEALKEYNDNFAYMGLVLFEDALKHVCRITRIVLPPGGHSLLVGVGGSGKQSLTKLAAFIMTYTLFMITISSNYGMNDLRTDLQLLYQKSGVKDEPIMFLFNEGQITNERFLTYINDLLSSGEVAELYNSDEKEVLINQIRPKVKADGRPDTRDSCWGWFIDKVRQNLHMTLCFSPVGESLRKRARQFPALVNSTVIDWFQPWPQDALYNVAQQFLKDIDVPTDQVREAIVKFMPFSFKLVNDLSVKLLEQERRYVYTTPKSFLELIKLYIFMLKTKKGMLEKNKERYENGLIKLRSTQALVAEIEIQVKEKQQEAEQIKNEANQVAEVVGKEKAKAEVENAKAADEEAKCSTIKQDVEQKKTSTQADLDAAIPLVEQAKAALNGLSEKDFQVAKNFATPPAGVPDVFSATIFLLAGFYNEQIEVDPKSKKPKAYDWKSAQKMMQKPKELLNKLMGFKDIVDANQVPTTNVDFVKKNYLNLEHFNAQTMANKSSAARGLCDWVINIVKYYDVIQIVEPKRQALKEAIQQLDDANAKLAKVQEQVKELNDRLAVLTADYNKAMAQLQAALDQAAKCEKRLNSANRLVKALGSENERWDQAIKMLEGQIQLLSGDVLVSAAFVSYAGPFNKRFRDVMIKDYFLKFIIDNKVPLSNNADPVKLLTDESTIAKWNQQLLPSDAVSTENGTILTNSERYPLIIDPQLQGIKWIKEKESSNNMKILRIGQKNTNRQIEFSIQAGNPCLIENMDERIDAVLMPVIARQFIIKSSGQKKIKFAGQELDVHPKFQLFLHTQLSNPHYPPEIQAEATLINFTVTEDGLSDQLLALVVGRERPDLAQKKVELIQQQNSFKIKLKELEDELLYKLANAEGDILEDIALIENLEYSKKISTEIAEKVEIAKATEAKINETSEQYRNAAARGALIYFLLTDLSKIHSFYKYSLESYLVVVHRAIDLISEHKYVQTGVMLDEKAAAQIDLGKKKEGEDEEAAEGEEGEQQEEQQEEQQQEQQQEEQQQGEQQEGEQGEGQQGEGEEGGEAKEGEEGEQKKEEQAEEQKRAADDDQLTPQSLRKRVNQLIESITYTSFQYARRGLFERHKLIVSTMLTLRINLKAGKLPKEQVDHLIIGKIELNPPPMPESLKSFLNDTIWACCKALESIPEFNGLGQSLEVDNLQWKKWYNEEKAEISDLPKAFSHLKKFHRLLLLRTMRPDRLTSAMANYVAEEMGDKYVEQPPFSIFETFSEMAPTTPIFFVLFPGVDPTPEVERVAAQYDITSFNGKFINISMGQGQEEIARKALLDCAVQGHWIMLQNVHLMQNWLTGLNGLEGYLETVYAKHHPNFRVFISSEPPPLPEMKIIPESILQASVKVANEAPQDLKANLRRAYAHFDQEFLNKCQKKPSEFKACLFALCHFHSLVLGRKKFGAQGWSRIYNFNDGDLTICANVLYNYLSKYDVVPWDDLKYIFGEIMYGGHITDDWDRRTNATYLKVLIKPELLQPNFSLGPGFKSPDPSRFEYEQYKEYIEKKLPIESPQMFGMHPNAEIGYLTQQCETLFSTILDVQGGSSSGGGGKKDDGVMTQLTLLKSTTPADTNLMDVTAKASEKTPDQIVCLQECERMNILLGEIRRSLEDLRLGMTGALNITDQMEALSLSLQFNKVPASWEKFAYFSRKGLAAWFNDLIERTNQLAVWTQEMVTPISLCISYLFNPMSFLTAIMQKTAREQGLPLDDMVLQTNVTAIKGHEEVTVSAETGAYIHGLYLEGAAWELGGQGQEGYLIEQKQKELHPKLPVVNVIAVTAEKKKKIGQYQCPVYVTSMRGPTFVFTANLNMENEDSDPSKWILSGTCLLMSDD
uniref:PtDNAH9b protein n=2 Tax=Paramecium tetraurelia TaxID=5888 RepID=A0A383SAY1_PARTE|nr:PtDNAH9b [Paramecium tetraurelia]